MPLRDFLVTLIIFGSLPIILAKPHVGVLVWTWLAYMNPQRFTWGFAYDFRFSLIVGVVTILAWLFSREPKRLPSTPVIVLLVLFTLWICVTSLTALVPDQAYIKWTWVMKMLLMTYITLFLMQDRDRLNALIWVIVVSVGFFGIKAGIFVLLTGGQWLTYGPPGTFLGSNNALALALIMVLPLMRYLQLQTERTWVRWGLAGAMFLSLFSVLASYSRGAAVALVAMLLVLWIKSRRRALVAALVVALMVVGIFFMPEKWTDRIRSIEHYEQDSSAQGRFDAWRFAFNLAKARPIVGGGFEVYGDDALFFRYSPGATKSRSFHSNYFEVMGEHGFVGLALYLALGAAAFLTGTWVSRRTRNHPDLGWARDLAVMTQVSLVGYAVGGVFLNKAYFDLYYHLVTILVLTRVLVARELAERAKEVTSPIYSA